MVNEQLVKWIKDVEKSKKVIEKLKVVDRLEAASSITTLHGSIVASLQGWSIWLKNPAILNKLSLEELTETFEIYKRLAIDFLDLDLKMSRAVLKRDLKTKTKKEKKKTGYVA